jgi:hypothetical protein
MANIVYEWNPFQQRIDNRITDEVIKTSDYPDRVEFVPRAAPFFSRNFELYRQGSAEPLKLGYDYCFGHSFDGFIEKYNRNVFGSVIMLRPMAGDVLLPKYDTIGAGFVLDQVAFAELVANIVNSPRVADWSELDGATIPTEFPPDPHDQPIDQTYDYQEMMTQLKSLILSSVDSSAGVNVKALLEEHLSASLIEAHASNKGDIGLPLTPNMMAALRGDLAGNSGNLLVTMDVFKEGLRRLAAGTLNLGDPADDGSTNTAPSAPADIDVAVNIRQSSEGNTLTISGSKSNDGTPVTYSITQSGAAQLTFSKTANIGEGETITFTAPGVANPSQVLISAIAVDNKGASSVPKTVTVTVMRHNPPTTPATLIVPESVFKGSSGNTITVGGSSASDGATVTYSLSQVGPIPVTFSKSSGIEAGEKVSFSVGDGVTVDTKITIAAVAVDSQGSVSSAKSAETVISIAPTQIGTSFGGGYFMGRMLIAGINYALVLAPKSYGEFPVPFSNEAAVAWAKQLTIGGYTDWRLPSVNMIDMIYRVCKPTASQNAKFLSPYMDKLGVNPESVPPGVQYTDTDPGITKLPQYQTTEVFSRDFGENYWTSDRDGRYAGEWYFRKSFSNGSFNTDNTGYAIARAVRLVRL